MDIANPNSTRNLELVTKRRKESVLEMILFSILSPWYVYVCLFACFFCCFSIALKTLWAIWKPAFRLRAATELVGGGWVDSRRQCLGAIEGERGREEGLRLFFFALHEAMGRTKRQVQPGFSIQLVPQND